MHLSDFNYELPDNLIAKTPTPERDKSRLMVLDRKTGSITHSRFYELSRHLPKNALVVVNDTRVVPARFVGRKKFSGGKLEVLFLRHISGETWEVMVKGKVHVSTQVVLVRGKMSGTLTKCLDNGRWLMEVEAEEDVYSIMESEGKIPLPPYIRKQRGKVTELKREKDDRERYQTVYADKRGAVAAPTAGLHFTKGLFAELESSGIEVVKITLHVGMGTFSPVRSENVLNHTMESESYIIPECSAEIINKAKKSGKKIVAVGTTTTRALESVSKENGEVVAGSGESNLMIIPGYRFKVVDALITNFHLPKSTLLLLVSAFAGKEHIFAAYEEAIREQYRFYSYGDGMLIQ